jgi:F-type H+-transporting ATPase subunit delta
MKISKQARQEAKQLFRACLVNGGVEENRVRQTVTLMLARKPRAYLSILTHFQRLVKLAVEERTAWISTVVPLTPPQQSSLQNLLTQRYGPGLYFNFGTQPALIGGMRVRVGSDVFDGSLQARLTALQDSFSKS